MTKKRSAIDALEGVFTLAAAWLALRGEDPSAIAARAQSAAQAAETARKRLESFVMGRVRTAMECSAPAACSCLVCSAFAAEQQTKPENLS